MNAHKLAEGHALIAAGHAKIAEALQEDAGAPVAEPSRARQKPRARPLVGPLRPVTDDVAVARAKRQQLGWKE